MLLSVKQLKKEAYKLEMDIKKLENAEREVSSTFSEAIKFPLIRSNKKKYLIEINGALHPKTSEIVRDTAFLQTYYKNKVPDNVKDKKMGPVFQSILSEYHNKHVKRQQDPILSILKDKGVKFPEKPQKKQQSSSRKEDNTLKLSKFHTLCEQDHVQKGRDRVLSLLQENEKIQENDFSAGSPPKLSQLSNYMDDDEALEMAMRRSLYEQSVHDIVREFPPRVTKENTPTNSPDSKKFKSSESVAGLQESFSKMPTPGKEKPGHSEDISASMRPRQSPSQSYSGYSHQDWSGMTPYTSSHSRRSQTPSSVGSGYQSMEPRDSTPSRQSPYSYQSKDIRGLTSPRQSPYQSYPGYYHQDWSRMTPYTSPNYQRNQTSSSLSSANVRYSDQLKGNSAQENQSPFRSFPEYSTQNWSTMRPYTQASSSQGMYSVYNKPMSPLNSMSTAHNPSKTPRSQDALSQGPASYSPGYYTSHFPAQNQGYPPVHAPVAQYLPNQSASRSQLPLAPSQPNSYSVDRSQIKFKPYE